MNISKLPSANSPLPIPHFVAIHFVYRILDLSQWLPSHLLSSPGKRSMVPFPGAEWVTTVGPTVEIPGTGQGVSDPSKEDWRVPPDDPGPTSEGVGTAPDGEEEDWGQTPSGTIRKNTCSSASCKVHMGRDAHGEVKTPASSKWVSTVARRVAGGR